MEPHMLTKFEVENFKNFEKKLTLNFKNTNGYQFNLDCIQGGTVKKALIYGHNGIGKSNLGFALFDIISHSTDKQNSPHNYKSYLNAVSDSPDFATFSYEFECGEGNVLYTYTKADNETLISEEITINNETFAYIDRRNSTLAEIFAAGAEGLTKDIGDSRISLLSYIQKNTVLEKNDRNECFNKFISFVNGMLFFRSLEQNNYIGYEQGSTVITDDIVERDNIKDFESFLKDAGVPCKLSTLQSGENTILAFDFGKKKIPFFDIASQGTKSLTLFYFWYQRLRDKKQPSFVFIDEFDSFYHHSLSEVIVEKLKEVDCQVLLTSHNTSIITNELLRPDCYFLLDQEGIQSLANCTDKELREAHNIEKMYRAGAFCG